MEFYPFFSRPYYYNQYKNMRNTNYDRYKNQSNNTTTIQENSKSQNPEKFSETPIFEIFGIKLFFDDILIISLIFFLYNEGVRDNLLFVSLILILLS